MRIKNSIIQFLFICFLLMGFIFQCTPKSGSPIKIVHARRAEKYLSGNSLNYQELTAHNQETDALLDLRIDGIESDAFQAIPSDSIYVLTGEKRCGPFMRQSGIVAGKKIIRIIFVVPKQAEEFTFHLGSFPPKPFQTESKLYAEIKDWE